MEIMAGQAEGEARSMTFLPTFRLQEVEAPRRSLRGAQILRRESDQYRRQRDGEG